MNRSLFLLSRAQRTPTACALVEATLCVCLSFFLAGCEKKIAAQDKGGSGPVPVTAPVGGLTPGTVYRYRLDARNVNGGGPSEERELVAPAHPGIAPLAYPKSSPSIMAGASEPQSTGRKGLFALGPLVWMERATSSLPVPDSPTMRTGWVVPATLERMR